MVSDGVYSAQILISLLSVREGSSGLDRFLSGNGPMGDVHCGVCFLLRVLADLGG